MEIDESEIEKLTMVLIEFNRESTVIVGKIKLPWFTIGENKMTTFSVMNCPSVYNIILGRSWIYTMKAVTFTNHQRIRFSTKRRVRKVRRNQEVARMCYLSSMKLKTDDCL